MKLYLAGLFASNFDLAGRVYAKLDDREKEMRQGVEWCLESYHYTHRQKAVDRIRSEGRRVFLDSGAFSAFTMGVNVDLPKYCDYIQRNLDIIEHVDGQPLASVLDAIGSADGTWQNQYAMEQLGVRPLPCFHYGEPEEVLEYYAANYSYITIGGMVPISTPQLKLWLDRIWPRYLCNADGSAKVKVHGFGLTSLPLMMRYPWFSVDSSTWVQWSANGMILIPHSGRQINVSDRSSSRKMAGQHLDSVTPIETAVIENELREKDLICPKRLRELYFSRWAYNAYAFPKYASLRGNGCARFVPEEQGLF